MTKADSWVKFQNSNQCAWEIMNPVMKIENSGALNKPVGQAQQIFHLNQSSRHKDILHLGNYEEKNKPIIFFPKIKPRTSHLPTLTPCHLSNASKGTNPTNFSISRKVEETCLMGKLMSDPYGGRLPKRFMVASGNPSLVPTLSTSKVQL